jgi:two-component system NtrC family sensor kinase
MPRTVENRSCEPPDLQQVVDHLQGLLVQETAAREHLQRQLDLRNEALDAATTHFMIVNHRQPGAPIVYVNRALAYAHGCEPVDLIGASGAALVPRDLNPAQFEAIVAAQRAGDVHRSEVRCRRADGSLFWVGMFLGPICDERGRVTHYVAVGTDITSRLEEERSKRRLQEQLYDEMRQRERMSIELRLAQKLESVGRLAAGIAHEINTPIQYVGDSVSFLQSAAADLKALMESYRTAVNELASDSPAVLERFSAAEASIDLPFLREQIPKSFERTLEGIERVAAIVRAMKEFAHPDVIDQSSADVNRALETTLTVSRNEYRYLAVTRTEFGELPEVMCNIGELNQVFLNLIINAAHAIEKAGHDSTSGCITLTTAVAGDSVVIKITDNGCGIPDEIRENIFDPFFTTKEVGQGTGQGLAIARAIVVDKHRGTIDVDTRIGQGTTFTVTLPIRGRDSSP